jgi:uncharacterized protein YegP (UPF0339 family)
LVSQSSDSEQDWRWRFLGQNETTVAISGGGYVDKAQCVDAINGLADGSLGADIRYRLH